MRWWPKRGKREPVLTGNCMVRVYTADGHPMGPCWHSTRDGKCPTHGDVSAYLYAGHEHMVDVWPADYQLPMYDGVLWAEHLRAKQEKGGHR